MKLGVTAHAVERYVERVKPALDGRAAKRELLALVAMAEDMTAAPPKWVAAPSSRTDAWVELADGICAAVLNGDIVTILTRGGTTTERRADKAERKRRKRADRLQRQRASRPPRSLRGEGKWAERKAA